MSVSVALSAFGLLFLAELGDKTQIVAMTLAHRYRIPPVVAGVFGAFLVLGVLAVTVGAALYRYVPQRAVLVAAGALFLYFAWRSWQDSAGEADEGDGVGRGGAMLASFVLIFVAELGDKTQLVEVALAASSGDPLATLLGGTLALWSVSLIGILLGGTLLRRVPKVRMHQVAAGLFLVFGVGALLRAWLGEVGSGP